MNVAGTPLKDLADAPSPEQQQEIFIQVKNTAYKIIQRKGATCYAIGLATTQIVQAILHNQNRVLTVSSLVADQPELAPVYLSLPVVVNRQGVARRLNFPLAPSEAEQLQRSSQLLWEVIEQIQL